MITSTVTDLVTGLLNRVAQSANLNDFAQSSGYDTYMVNIPNQGSYILLSKSPASNQAQQAQNEPMQSLYTGTLDDFLVKRPTIAGNPLFNSLKGSSTNYIKRPNATINKKKMKKNKKKQPSFVIPLRDVNALHTFTDSRSATPLTDYELDYA